MNFPRGPELFRLLDLDPNVFGPEGGPELDGIFERMLNGPIRELCRRPAKSLRQRVVHLGFAIAARYLGREDVSPDLAGGAATILEIFHVGSLVVDDIEDGSLYRRGQKSLHHARGVPLALNAGNWLYFLPFKIIDDLPLPETRRRALARECQTTLLRAHYGQAIDLGAKLHAVEARSVPELALATMELKSGALFGLALAMGAVALGASVGLQRRLSRFGRRLGVALQMFDDVGNLSSRHNPGKACEDLKLDRLGHVFGTAARELGAADFAILSELSAGLPGTCGRVLEFLVGHGIPTRALTYASCYFDSILLDMQSEFGLVAAERETLNHLRTRLETSYA